jgi:hypothetical protein
MQLLTSIAAGLLLMAPALSAQTISAGTVIPVMLTTTLDSAKIHPGQEFTGKIMSNVPTYSEDIPAGSKVFGHVVKVEPREGDSGSRLALKFDRVVIHGRSTPIIANVRALATMVAVFDAQVPIFEPDTAPPSAMLFAPVGGDAAFRPDNPERSWKRLVRFSGPVPEGCGGRIDAEGGTGALWVFSPYACGAYGFGRTLAIEHDGTTKPMGEIQLIAPKNVQIHAGSGWLLRIAPAPDQSQAPTFSAESQ